MIAQFLASVKVKTPIFNNLKSQNAKVKTKILNVKTDDKCHYESAKRMK